MESKAKRKPFSNYTAQLKAEFNGYNFKWFLKDMISGISIALCIFPLIFACFSPSFLPENSSSYLGNFSFGIIGGIVSVAISNLIIAIIGGGTHQISAPTYALTGIVIGLTYASYGLQSAFLACAISGLLLVISGVLRLGKFVRYIPRPIICGLTLGASLILIIYSLSNIFGVNAFGVTPISVTKDFISNVKNINWVNFSIFIVTLALAIIYPKKLEKFLPSALILIVLSSVLVYVLKLNVTSLIELNVDFTNVEKFNIDKTTLIEFKSIIFPALSIWAITFTQSSVSGERSRDKTQLSFTPSYQLVAQGLANMVSPFFAGLPVSSSFESVAVSVNTGSKTRITNLFVSISVVALAFLISKFNVLPYISLPSLSAILIANLFKMNDYKSIKHYFKRKSFGAIILTFASAILVVVVSLPVALFVAMIIALFIMLINMREVEVYAELKKDLKTVGVSVTGPLYFGSIDDFLNKVKAINCEYDRLIFDFSGITYVDSTALQKTLDYLEILNQTKVIVFCGTRIKVLKTIAIDGFYQTFGAENFFPTFSDAYRSKYKKREIITPIVPATTVEENAVKVEEEQQVAVTEKYDEQTVKVDTEEITKVIPPEN